MINDRYKGIYRTVLVESFRPSSTSGKHGEVHIRPIASQVFSQTLFVSCSRKMTDEAKYKVGTKFKLLAKLTDRLSGGEYLYSNPRDVIVVVTDEEAKKLLAGLPKGGI